MSRRFKNFKSKRGSSMVEAAIVFPIAVFAILTVIYIIINMYSEVVVNAKLHMVITEEAGRLSDTIAYGEEWSDDGRVSWLPASTVEIERKDVLVKDSVRGRISHTAESKGLAVGRIGRTWEAERRIVDEEQFVRCMDVVLETTK